MIYPTPSILLVTYDLKTAGKIYTPFYEALKQQGTWWHYLSSTWLIATTKEPKELYDAVAHHLTTNDYILITRLTGPYWGYLPQNAWDWIRSHLS